MNREYVSDVDTDTDSDAELDYKAKKCALRTWKYRCAPANVPPADVTPGWVPIPTSDMTRSKSNNDEHTDNCEHEEWINRNVHSPWMCANHQHGWEHSDMQRYDSMDIAEWYPITTDCLQPEERNRLSHAVCDVSVALMPLIQINRALFSDGGDTTGRSGHDRDDTPIVPIMSTSTSRIAAIGEPQPDY